MAENILLHTEHLSKKFGEQFILKDISLDVKKSEVVVIIGPSGCGKSTFLRCINGLEPLSGGKVELDGQNISDSSQEPPSASVSAWSSKAMTFSLT